ncbi:MAG: hypothetical protein U0935_11365 [Pirellulales bacterium]
MEARIPHRVRFGRAPLALLTTWLAVSSVALSVQGASYRTQYFLVHAPTAEYAREVGEAAERLRRELALEWLGHELPPWRDSCPIEVVPASGAGGVTQFYFDHGQPHGWTMRVQGSRERVLDSVLPHEITHTVFATHFGRPLPRWADEGACTTTEDVSERRKQEKLLNDFLRTNRGIPFNRMFEMTEYPSDVLPLYAQGYSLARFLIALEGKPRFITFLGDGMKSRNWGRAVRQHYGFQDLSELQVRWNRWVAQGGQEQLAARFRSAPANSAPATSPPGAVATVEATPEAAVPRTSGPQVDALAVIPDATGGENRITPLVPPTTPADLAQTPRGELPRGSYYIRRRDEHRQAHPHLLAQRETERAKPLYVRPATSNSTRSIPAGRNSAGSVVPVHTARPQPPQPAQQVIIEWSRPTPTMLAP